MITDGKYLKGSGDFDAALRQMIRNVVDGKPHKDILAEWDYMRGTEWFTGTAQVPSAGRS